MTILDEYFRLSDAAGTDQAAFRNLMDCFSEDSSVRPAGTGREIVGKAAIRQFYAEFFRGSRDLRHVWTTRRREDRLEADWAVVGRRPDGTLFALQGTDLAELDDRSKIRKLTISFKG